jgi:hypothetical protein
MYDHNLFNKQGFQPVRAFPTLDLQILVSCPTPIPHVTRDRLLIIFLLSKHIGLYVGVFFVIHTNSILNLSPH